MRIATQTDAIGVRLGDKTAVEMIARAGFSGIDYSMVPMKKPDNPLLGDAMPAIIDSIKAVADRYSVPFTQAHAPFPSMRSDDDDYNKFIFTAIVRSMEIAGRLGVDNIITNRPDQVTELVYSRNVGETVLTVLKVLFGA